jgi:hypothetical protein
MSEEFVDDNVVPVSENIKPTGKKRADAIAAIFLMMVVARDKVKTTALTAIGVTLLLYLIFEVGLHMRLPKGPFGF